MKNSIVIRILKKDDAGAIARARANVKTQHVIEYEDDAAGCTIDTSALGGKVDFFTDVYVIVGEKVDVK